jgi:peptide/nickel transport system substrate-binding protein
MNKHSKNDSNWWYKLGEPQYGGELVIRANRNIVSFDPYITENLANIYSAWMERLVADDWTLDPAVFDYKTHWHPSRYMKGNLAAGWDFPDATTHVIHLRQGIHWQNIPPANGREFVADDVVFHFNRLCGLGGSFTKPSSPPAPGLHDLISVTAADRYTIVFKFKTPNPELIMEALHKVYPSLCLENPDAVKKWGDLNDWHHAIGTGPFILKDFVPGSSATLVKNPDYWGHDERHPENKLPYLDTVKFLVIPDDDIALQAMRARKIDILDVMPIQAQVMRKTNPEILQIPRPNSDAITVEPRNDVKPFNDIRVRKAMQMAIDLPSIAKYYYQNTVEPYPVMLTSRYMKGWGFPYEEWPPDLKDEYAYNPEAARQLLAEAGYPDGFKTNVVTNAFKNLELLQIVRSYSTAVGIDMEIRTMDTGSFIDFVSNGKKHDQLVHCPPGPLGHTASPFLELTRFRTGPGNWAMVDDPVFNDFLPKAMATSSYIDLKKIIRDANERVARQHFTISLLQPQYYSLCQPWVKGFNAQHGSTMGHTGGPGMLSFYLARFWIDQKLKKSMVS